MEKRNSTNTMLNTPKIQRIVITGPESTGKTELARALVVKMNAIWVPEYARQYVENLGRDYTYDDVVEIAKYQIAEEKRYTSEIQNGILIFDTWLIITKVWFDVVYGTCPAWIVDHIKSTKIDLFLVCATDLPWIADPVRENGGEKREELFKLYIREIRKFGFVYEIVEGIGEARLECALKQLSKHSLKL
jgi:NadR type nicotinamide-nucleotide adenylyltransferase